VTLGAPTIRFFNVIGPIWIGVNIFFNVGLRAGAFSILGLDDCYCVRCAPGEARVAIDAVFGGVDGLCLTVEKFEDFERADVHAFLAGIAQLDVDYGDYAHIRNS
jgi:hypothetical protein